MTEKKPAAPARAEASRRDFLRLAAVAVPGAAVAAVAPQAAKAAAPAPTGRYVETPHVRAYLDSCRF